MKYIFSVTIALLIAYTLSAQHINNPRLDSLFLQIAKDNNFMGGIAISEKGKIVYSKNMGYANVEAAKKLDNQTRYRMASISKTYTSALILKAVEEKKIQLDEPIDKYFPQVKNAHKITPRHMLTHRSGIHNFTEDKEFENYRNSGKSKDEMLTLISSYASDFEPDSTANYSNSNYVLLSYLLEKIYNKPYALILKDKIINPLKLKHTYVGEKIGMQRKEAFSYNFDKKWIRLGETNLDIFTGAGAIVSTKSETLQFVDALFSHQIISKNSLDIMLATKEEVGMGIAEFLFEDKVSYGHTGSIDGFRSMYGYFPKEDLSFIMISNGSSINLNDVVVAVLNILFNRPD